MNQTILWSPGVSLAEIEKQVIMKALQHFRNNKTVTANALGIAVRTIDNKLAQYQEDYKLALEKESVERIKQQQLLDRARGIVAPPSPIMAEPIQEKPQFDIKKRKAV